MTIELRSTNEKREVRWTISSQEPLRPPQYLATFLFLQLAQTEVILEDLY